VNRRKGGIPGSSVWPRGMLGVALAFTLLACGTHAHPDAGTHAADEPSALEMPAEPALREVADSASVDVTRPAIIAFYPIVSNADLEADEGLASMLDDFAYYLGTGMDSLEAAGFRVSYHAGDTVRIRAGRENSRFVRHPDSAVVGYLFADHSGHLAVVYGVRTDGDLLRYAREFIRTGRIPPR
jgi:hypothetical protein